MLNHPSLTELLPSGIFMANDDYNHRMVAIDPATGALVWRYGITGKPGAAPAELNTPDGLDLLQPDGSTRRIPRPDETSPGTGHRSSFPQQPAPPRREAGVAGEEPPTCYVITRCIRDHDDASGVVATDAALMPQMQPKRSDQGRWHRRPFAEPTYLTGLVNHSLPVPLQARLSAGQTRLRVCMNQARPPGRLPSGHRRA